LLERERASQNMAAPVVGAQGTESSSNGKHSLYLYEQIKDLKLKN
jgi:hypothetical protein